MTISGPLEASARSAYRHVLRSTRILCAGDPHGRSLARAKLRAAYLAQAAERDPVVYAANVGHAREVGDLLLRHVVQGKPKEGGVYDLQILPTTEIGSNESIRAKAKVSDRPASERSRPFPNRLRTATAALKAEATTATATAKAAGGDGPSVHQA